MPSVPMLNLWGHRLATLGLGPLLLAQGYYVRHVTPRLPEAEGERSGLTGAGIPLRLLLVGDSAAAGVGAASQAQALSGQLCAALAPRFNVSWKLVAKSGHTTRQVLDMLAAEAPGAFDVAITSTGVNDVTGGTPPRRWLLQQEQLVKLLREKFQVRQVLLSALPPMHLFPSLPAPLNWYLGQRATLFNRSLAQWAAAQAPHCEFAPMEYPLRDGLIADDGFHPGPGAYALWAEFLAGHIRRRWLMEESESA